MMGRPGPLFACLLACLGPGSLRAAAATISINASSPVNTFIPLQAFGNNIGYWDGRAGLAAIGPKLLRAGNHFFRFPGGSSSDDFHWNGVGSFDASGHWVSDDTAYAASWTGSETDRGTSSSYGVPSNLTDGDPGTRWLSNADTDTPNAQWAYVDLGAAKTVNQLLILWSTPYATQFKVQAWAGAAGWPLPYNAPSDQWADCSSGLLAGAGGSQAVTFTAVSSQWFRVLCLASSASPAQYSIAELTAFNGAAQVSVNVATSTNNSPDQSWGVVSSTDVATAKQQVQDLDFEGFMAWLKAYSPMAKPLITVNMGTGTPQEAAAWVHYANVVRGYGITDWEVGNEMEGNWETGGPLNSNDYARRFIEYAQAMKAADPSIHVYGPVSAGPYEEDDLLDGRYHIKAVVDRLAADAGGDKAALLEGMDFHWYPLYGTAPTEAQSLALNANMQQFAQTDLPAMLANHPARATLPVLMTEFNVGISCPLTVHQSAGLWLADWLGSFVTQFGQRGSSHIWEALEAGDADSSVTGSSLGFLNGTNNAYLYQERAQAWAMQMLTQDWAIPGDVSAHTLVQAVSSQGLLSAYADKRPDGVLSLLVINKDPVNAYNATISLAGFSPNASAARWTWDGSNYAWSTAALPYHASPDSPPTAGTETGVAAGFSHSFGPYSITVLQFTDSTQPLSSPTPTVTPPPSPTPTPTWGPTALIDDFEDPARNAGGGRLDLWNGSWGTSQIAGAAAAVNYGAAPRNGSYGAAWSLTVPAGGWANWQAGLGGVVNAAADGFLGIQFWAFGDGSQWRAMVTTLTVTDYNDYGLNFTPPAGVWTLERIPFSSMQRQGGWGTQTGLPLTPTAQDLTGIHFATQSTGVMRLGLDDLAFYGPSALVSPTPSPTFSASPSASVSPTPTPSFSPSVTFSVSPTLSPSLSASLTPSISPTWTMTPSPSVTATVTPTLTPAAGGGLNVLKAMAAPNPVTAGPGHLRLLLDGPATSLQIRAYSVGWQKVAEFQAPGGGPGWVDADLVAGALPRNGLFYLRVRAWSGPRQGPWALARAWVAR